MALIGHILNTFIQALWNVRFFSFPNMPRLTNPIFTSHRRETISEVNNSVYVIYNLGGALDCAPNSISQSALPVEIIHATESSDGVTNNIYHCWLLHSKIGEIQIILMFQQNIFLIAFFLLRFHVIYQIFFAALAGSKIICSYKGGRFETAKMQDLFL